MSNKLTEKEVLKMIRDEFESYGFTTIDVNNDVLNIDKDLKQINIKEDDLYNYDLVKSKINKFVKEEISKAIKNIDWDRFYKLEQKKEKEKI